MAISSTRPARQQMAKPMLRALVAAGVGIALAALIGLDSEGWWLVPLFAGSAATALLLWRGYRWPDDWSVYLSFGGAVLLALAVNRALYIADFALSGARFSHWPFDSSAPEWAVFKGEVLTLAGTLITVAVWLAAGGAKYSPRLLLNVPRSGLTRVLVVAYALSVVGSLIMWSNREAVAFLGQLFPVLHGLGVATSFFLPFALTRNRLVALCLTCLLSVPFIYSALLSGMKEDIIVALVPAAYVAWLATRNVTMKLGIVAVAVVLVSIITPYVGYVRDEAWTGGRELTQQQAISEFADSQRGQGGIDAMGSGFKAFAQRNNASVHRGWAVSLADEYGFEPALVFDPLLYVFIPRFIWPAKPEIRQGWEYSGLVFGEQYIAWSGSSTAAGLYPALYLGYGWPAVFAGAALIGLLLAGMFRLAWRLGGPLLVGLYGFSLLPFSLRLDETWTVGAVSGPIIGFAYVAMVFFLARFLGKFLKVGSRQ